MDSGIAAGVDASAAPAPVPHTLLDDWADAHAAELSGLAPEAARAALIDEYQR